MLQLPRNGLATRFGAELILRIDQLLEQLKEPFPAWHRRPEDRSCTDLDYPTHDREILQYQITTLVKKLANKLKDRGHGALQLSVRLWHIEHPVTDFQIGLFMPSADPQHWERLLSDHFLRTRLPADVRRIELAASLTGPLQQRQVSLLDDADGTGGNQAVANLVNNLSGRLGRHAVLGVSRRQNPLPEESYRLQPLTGQPIGEIARLRKSRLSSSRSKRIVSKVEVLPTPEDPLRRPLRTVPR